MSQIPNTNGTVLSMMQRSTHILSKCIYKPSLLCLDVKGLVSESDIKRTLVEYRNKIQTLSDETSVSMKKNVYRNYKQFIDTSKEISCIFSIHCYKILVLQIDMILSWLSYFNIFMKFDGNHSRRIKVPSIFTELSL